MTSFYAYLMFYYYEVFISIIRKLKKGSSMFYRRHSSHNCDTLRDLVPSVRFEKCENNYGEVLLLVKLQASANY